MNAMTASSSTLRRLIATAIFSALASGMSTGASADSGTLPEKIVKFGDLDVSSSQGASILYNRIRLAAEEVCAPLSHGDLPSKMHEKACVSQAIEQAVFTANRPALSAVHASKQPTRRPVALAAAQKP